jgi:peptidyl-tRNA hydrolase, PTH1 family
VDEIFLIVGLGNPGLKYAKTRHNVGFLVIDKLLDSLKAHPTTSKIERSFESYKIKLEASTLILLKPLTFMNNSGEAVRTLTNFYKVSLNNTIVIHDELDLPLGRVQLKQGGGEAGHNGLKSISHLLGSKNYIRLRFGIDRPRNHNNFQSYESLGSDASIVSWVLGNFSHDELKKVSESCSLASLAVMSIINSGFKESQKIFNQKSPSIS